ncbi:ATP-binding cassette domain-containing protein [Cocleimonas sp. KMM 6892]|uniref:ABC transporter ATP-binding protein n=1 Tax=unclassified Cocleimonas TaxID=2639732 RepID=UPI002DBEC324|nr:MULTISPECIES: ATP-binding cassette domain-containing protein [unclassified Cocleimonas]MEB8432674.1 ATP-binding cassette domain-containing protein [Cocleimonas sp. KMM 6892]MEC4715533.1 ATP-binding cassette domain-containing protein [Cocleimonas sp. KMM 6895]MEC4744849.1 ATP-binding cassette domain-containing protein [Cocleimonas sp. KMM 6896]
MNTILETIDLKRTFGAVVAASNINIKIGAGEVLGVIGSNGAGKTTFVNMVTGYLEPSSGQILFHGESITGKKTRDITRLGICRSFQIPQLFMELTVIDNIIIALTVAREVKPSMLKPTINKEIFDEAMGILRRFQIDQYAESEVGVLAQGIRKLIDIAMATVGDPELLFLDEPTSGVSADEKMQIMDVLISALKSTKTAVLFIEHDMEIIEKFAPRVIAFYEGTVLADGDAADVLENEKVREFVIGKEFHRQAETEQQGGIA